MVMIRGRFTGHGQPAPWIAVDFVRMEDGLLREHGDVIEDEVARTSFRRSEARSHNQLWLLRLIPAVARLALSGHDAAAASFAISLAR
jgi:hypothetical protein